MSLRAAIPYFTLLFTAFVLAGCARHGGANARPSPNVPGANLTRGAAVFARECSACHGVNGKGGEIGPSLRNEHIRRTYHDVRSFILRPDPPMPKLYPSRLSANEVRDVSAYVESL